MGKSGRSKTGMDGTEMCIANRREEIRTAAAMVERFAAERRIPAPVIHDISVALDEVLVNIISYAFAPGEESEILVRLVHQPGEIELVVEDAGKPFDPLQAPAPNLGASLKARQVGGLGIHFVKSLMDEVSYERAEGRNRLKLRKRLPTGAASESS
jgi:anti-sigma regulatory factor (Ser/Thr protein kinase)